MSGNIHQPPVDVMKDGAKKGDLAAGMTSIMGQSPD